MLTLTSPASANQIRHIGRLASDAVEKVLEELGLDKDGAQSVHSRGDEFVGAIRKAALVSLRELSVSKSILINRVNSFNPATFISRDWTFWRGPVDGDGLEGELEQDEKSLALTRVDLSRALLETHLKPNDEIYTTGEERLKRLIIANQIRSDLTVFKVLWENQHLIPEDWEHKGWIFCDGQTLRSPSGSRSALYFRMGGFKWDWDVDRLSHLRGSNGPSLVLAS